MARQLFYGKLDSVSPVGNGDNSYIRVRGNFSTTSTTITNVVDVSGFLGLNEARVGQQLVVSGIFASGTTITAIDVGNNTITVEDNPSSDGTNSLARISPAPGEYFIPSASITDPQGLVNFGDITGSDDSNFNNGTQYALLGQAADSNNLSINGRFHKYFISEVLYRKTGNLEASIYVKWGEKGTESDSGDQLFIQDNQKLAIVALTPSESLAPIFSPAFSGITDLNVGQGVAAFQIEVQDFLDDIVTTDVFDDGVRVSSNLENLNFTGNGVTVSTSGSRGVEINIPGGGGGDLFPYTGSAKITGSLEVIGFTNLTGSTFIQGTTGNDALAVSTSGGDKKFSINSEGVAVLAEMTSIPTAVEGGIYYSQSQFYFGIE